MNMVYHFWYSISHTKSCNHQLEKDRLTATKYTHKKEKKKHQKGDNFQKGNN